MNITALKELTGHRQEYARQANAMLEKAGGKIWTKEEKESFDTITDKIELLDSQIEAHKVNMENAADFVTEREVKDEKKDSPYRAIYKKFLRDGIKGVSADEWKIVNTMSTTTGSEGGFTVQTEIAQSYIDALKSYAGMRNVSSQITTSQGNPMNFPTTDGTAETGEWVAENVAATAADVSFGSASLNVFKASSKIVTIPFELLQDTTIDIEGLVRNRLTDRIGRISNTGFTTGTGTAQPRGVVTGASVGKTGTTGQTLTVVYDDLVDLIDSVDIAYHEANFKFMFSQAVRKVIRKIKDTSGRPIWTPSYDAGIAGGLVDNVLGYAVQINNDMPTPAANAKSIAFGDFSKYQIRDAMQFTLFRFDDSPFASKGQVGFLAWARTGGNLLDTAAVKLYQHSAT